MRRAFCLLIVSGVIVGCAAQAVNISWDLRPATRSNYGYTAEDPIRIGYYKDFRENIGLCNSYLASLRTTDQRPMQVVGRSSVRAPRNEPEEPKGFLGLPKRGGLPTGGILDEYLLVPVGTTDTLRLYFDVYHKDSLQVPRGLSFTPPSK